MREGPALARGVEHGLDAVAGRISLFATAFLSGILLAVFGQVYQTGADPYGLFLAWALLILPWAVPNYVTALAWKGMFRYPIACTRPMPP